jgi:hypothetical protein
LGRVLKGPGSTICGWDLNVFEGAEQTNALLHDDAFAHTRRIAAFASDAHQPSIVGFHGESAL